MKDSCTVDVLHAPQELVHEESDVVDAQLLVGFDDAAQVSFHQVENHINFVELLQTLGLNDSFDVDNVVMLQQA